MDHIVTNLFLSANIYSSALLTNTFDHFLIFTFVSEVIGLNENCKKKKTKQTISKQKINQCLKEAFCKRDEISVNLYYFNHMSL